MKKIKILIILFTVFLLISPAWPKKVKYCKIPPKEKVSLAYVTRVIDGDTIVVKIRNKLYKVRLIGIDTPETVHPRKPVEYFGKEASAYTKKHLSGKTIKLTYDRQKKDRYGRLLAYVWIKNKLFNLMIIRDGYAFAYLKYPFRNDYMKKFRAAQKYAHKHKLGLWK